jgi:transposase InsO family protein
MKPKRCARRTYPGHFLEQQERFDRFFEIYNYERPREALSGAYPGDLQTSSARL